MKWQNFFSLGGGWLMTEEEFMKDIKWLDMLKIKASYGTLGNQNLDKAYPAEPLLTDASQAVFGKPSIIYPGYQLAYLPNPTLRWEKVRHGKPGFETNMLRNRLHFEGVYYMKTLKICLLKFPGILPEQCPVSVTWDGFRIKVWKWQSPGATRSVNGDIPSAPTLLQSRIK